MSDEESPPPAEAIPVRTEHALATRPVRMSLRPSARLTAGADFKLWLTRFEMYVQQAGISETQRVKELLSLLEDEPFRVVSQHGLLESDDFHAVTECLRQHYAPDGYKLHCPTPHLWIFANKTACLAPKLQVSMCPRPFLWICACKTDTLGPEFQVYMGPRPRLWICECKTAFLAPDLQVSMGPRLRLWICACKTAT